jgi:hypothetical protein
MCIEVLIDLRLRGQSFKAHRWVVVVHHCCERETSKQLVT